MYIANIIDETRSNDYDASLDLLDVSVLQCTAFTAILAF